VRLEPIKLRSKIMARPKETIRLTKSMHPDVLDELIITGYQSFLIRQIHMAEAELQETIPFSESAIRKLVAGRKKVMDKREREKYTLPDREEIIAILERGDMREMVRLLIRQVLSQTA